MCINTVEMISTISLSSLVWKPWESIEVCRFDFYLDFDFDSVVEAWAGLGWAA